MLTKNKYAFAGLGLSKLGKVPDLSATELAAQAIEAALADSGLDRSEVDGFIYQPAFDPGPQGTTALMPTGIPARFAWQLQTGSTSGLSAVGGPDEKWGEVPVAFIIARDGALSSVELEEWCGQSLARYKIPRRWLFVEDFPRTANGKVRKAELQQQLAQSQ